MEQSLPINRMEAKKRKGYLLRLLSVLLFGLKPLFVGKHWRARRRGSVESVGGGEVVKNWLVIIIAFTITDRTTFGDFVV